MALVAGIDPGTNGAIAVYDTDTHGLISVDDLPFYHMTINKKKRKRLDPVGLMEMFDMLKFMGVELVVLEAVGGRPRQSASAGFVFGYTVGCLYTGCLYTGIMVETVPPTQWKKLLKVPGKAGGKGKEEQRSAEVAIKVRCKELFPNNQDLLSTARGAFRMDRADASFLAKFGGDYVLRTLKTYDNDVEAKLAYRYAETGA